MPKMTPETLRELEWQQAVNETVAAWEAALARIGTLEKAIADIRTWALGSVAASPGSWVKAIVVVNLCDAALAAEEPPYSTREGMSPVERLLADAKEKPCPR